MIFNGISNLQYIVKQKINKKLTMQVQLFTHTFTNTRKEKEGRPESPNQPATTVGPRMASVLALCTATEILCLR